MSFVRHQIGPAAALLALTAVVLLAFAASARAQEGPEVTFLSIEEGQVVSDKPAFIKICFRDPVDIRDLSAGGDFSFSLKTPDGILLGLRIIFEPNGYGVAVQPGLAPGETQGEWEFHYRVRAAGGGPETEDTIAFTVQPDGTPVPTSTADVPAACPAPSPTRAPATSAPAGGTDGPTATGAGSSPAATEGPGSSPTRTGTNGSATPRETGDGGDDGATGSIDGNNGDDDDGPDILLLALLTIGVVGIASVLGVIGYLVRRRAGFEPHEPPPGGPPSEPH